MKKNLILLVFAIASLTTSCKKEKIANDITPTKTNASASKIAGASMGQCPSSISLNGNSPNGNKLMAHFNPANVTASIVVVQNGNTTSDIQTTSGNSGVWVSRNKYTSPELGLNLLNSAGELICTCNYDVNGNLKTTSNACVISNAKAVLDSSGTAIIISWHSDVEVGLKSYIIERINSNTGSRDRLNMPVTIILGANNNYSVVDYEVFEDVSVYSYTIYANFLDNSTAPLIHLIPATR